MNFVTVCFEVETKSVDHVRICNCDRSYEMGSYLIFDFFFQTLKINHLISVILSKKPIKLYLGVVITCL